LGGLTALPHPVHATPSSVPGAIAYTGDRRQIRYKPDVTIVAAWISALTGVGPAVRPVIHTYSGICALLPVQPRNSISVAAVATVTGPSVKPPGMAIGAFSI